VLEALEASIAAHPASGRRMQGRRSDASRTAADATATSPSTGSNVVRFVPRNHSPHPPEAA